ncbi:hypothetical protein KZ829_21875 [Actinoplanes hulinensis]|uniref:Uncharacterized protein n=1 Tax=Actinoplanes hulinensis TaxID=1144547 RepID=A0ABS7B674_9ACTN|nr:hypothetical protein [Actinoplanes hulinensis]MBW6436392.1 hypothetical protein [Actinoplanes hulinensis]
MKSRMIVVVVVLALAVGLAGPGAAHADAGRDPTRYAAAQWKEVVEPLLLANKKVIARCVGNGLLLTSGGLRLLRPGALLSKLLGIAMFAQGATSASCRATLAVARAAYRVGRAGWYDGTDFYFQDASYVDDIRWDRNVCHIDLAVGSPGDRLLHYRATYRICHPATYSSTAYPSPDV